MTITPEKLKRMRACTAFDMPGDMQIELLDHIDAQAARIAQLTAERDALRESEMGDGKYSNTRAAADIYFQLVEECNIPGGGSLVEYIDDMKEQMEAAEKELAALREQKPLTVANAQICFDKQYTRWNKA